MLVERRSWESCRRRPNGSFAAICAVLGVIAIIYAVIYLAVPIHSLPGFVPGKKAMPGHYHKRALISAVIGIVLLAIAVYLGMTTRRSTATQAASTPEPAAGRCRAEQGVRPELRSDNSWTNLPKVAGPAAEG